MTYVSLKGRLGVPSLPDLLGDSGLLRRLPGHPGRPHPHVSILPDLHLLADGPEGRPALPSIHRLYPVLRPGQVPQGLGPAAGPEQG